MQDASRFLVLAASSVAVQSLPLAHVEEPASWKSRVEFFHVEMEPTG